MFTGLLLKESLKDKSVLDLVHITKIEIWDVDHAASFQPKVWTAIYFEGDKSDVEDIAEKLSGSLKPHGWYINISTKEYAYVIFPNKIFKYRKRDKEKEREAIEYGKTLDIPKSQLDWRD